MTAAAAQGPHADASHRPHTVIVRLAQRAHAARGQKAHARRASAHGGQKLLEHPPPHGVSTTHAPHAVRAQPPHAAKSAAQGPERHTGARCATHGICATAGTRFALCSRVTTAVHRSQNVPRRTPTRDGKTQKRKLPPLHPAVARHAKHHLLVSKLPSAHNPTLNA